MDTTIAALFEKPDEVVAVRDSLVGAGFDGKDVAAICNPPVETDVGRCAGHSILSWFDEDLLENNRCCVSIFGPADQVARAADIIQRHHPRDVRRQVDR